MKEILGKSGKRDGRAQGAQVPDSLQIGTCLHRPATILAPMAVATRSFALYSQCQLCATARRDYVGAG